MNARQDQAANLRAREQVPETAVPGEFGSDPEDMVLSGFFHFLELVPMWVWSLGLLAVAVAWILIAPWAGGVLLAVLVVGVIGWSIIRARRQHKA